MLKTINILAYSVADETPDKAAVQVAGELSAQRPMRIAFLNPHSVVLADQDAELSHALRSAEIIFCDGAGLALACRILKRQRIQRVYGYEFFIALSRTLSAKGGARVMFLGGSEDVTRQLVETYGRDFPGIASIDYFCPPYRPRFSAEEIAGMKARIAAYQPDVLWIGLGSPKQEKVMQQLHCAPGVPCSAAVGAVFDFYTGRIAHAPAWMRRLGLQWLHRLLLEPRRLWRRSFVSGPLFVLLVLRTWLRGLRREGHAG